jgi:hypothetical protein
MWGFKSPLAHRPTGPDRPTDRQSDRPTDQPTTHRPTDEPSVFPKSLLGTWGRAFHIDRRRAKSGPDHNQVALLVAIVAFAVNSTLGNMDEITSNCADHLRAAWSRFQP